MFYSTELFQKNGPLAPIWASAHMDRKLSKFHILQSNLTYSIEQIMAPTQAPLALRVKGQLLLGVVRIYHRKSSYLLEDCTEALAKIKLAFRPSVSNEIPAAHIIPDRASLIVPDRTTEHNNHDLPELHFTRPDDVVASPVFGRKGLAENLRHINLQEDLMMSSQFISDDFDFDAELGLGPPMDNIDSTVDFNVDFGVADELVGNARQLDLAETSDIEMGRDGPAQMPVEDELYGQFDRTGAVTPQKGRDRLPSQGPSSVEFDNGVRIADEDGDMPMLDNDFHVHLDDDHTVPVPELADDPRARARVSESPLSDIDPEFEREVIARWNEASNIDLYEQQDGGAEDAAAAATAAGRRPSARARPRRQKLLAPDSETTIPIAKYKELESNPDPLLQPSRFLSRNPFALALETMQRSGAFVTNVALEGRTANWAPELQGLLSLDVQSAHAPSGRSKRRRLQSEPLEGAATAKSPRLNLGPEEEFGFGHGVGRDSSTVERADRSTSIRDESVLQIPSDEQRQAHNGQDGGRDRRVSMDIPEADMSVPPFDQTVIPVVHPADGGPISIGTKHAVHILRDVFGPEAAEDEEKRRTSHVVFQHLVPERKTTKADATKMFFECLVLATKDAIKVEQGEALGSEIRLRGKRGLWGAWAEREAGRQTTAGEGDDDGEGYDDEDDEQGMSEGQDGDEERAAEGDEGEGGQEETDDDDPPLSGPGYVPR